MKVIMKIIASRIKGDLAALISDCQGAFIGRSLSHNAVVAMEIVHGYGSKRVSPRCTIKVDLQKAYDYLSWEFVRATLMQLQFPEKLIDLIMECVSASTFLVLINGELEGFFQGKCCIRQGDLLSPYLFVLCMEMLSRKSQASTSNPQFKFHPKCKDLRLVHLAFADDLLVFCRADIQSVRVVKECLDEFFAMSGLRLNNAKSTVFLAGVTKAVDKEIVEHIGFEKGVFPVKYLGMPLQTRNIRVYEFSQLYDKVGGLFNSWTARNLFYAGRLQLLKSVFVDVHNF